MSEMKIEWQENDDDGDHTALVWYGDDKEAELWINADRIQLSTGSLTVTVDAGSTLEESKRFAEGWLPHFIKFVTAVNEVAGNDWRQQLCNQKTKQAPDVRSGGGFAGNGSPV